MAVSKRLRYEIFRRDNHACRYCGASAPDVKLQVDHVVPESLGGTDEPSNLVTSCVHCNAGKSSTSPDAELVDDVEQDALRWNQAMARAAEHQATQRKQLELFADFLRTEWIHSFGGALDAAHVPDERWHFKDDPERTYEWIVYDVADETRKALFLADTEDECWEHIRKSHSRDVPPLPEDWDASLHVWLAAGITDVDVIDAVKVVMRAGHVPWGKRYRYFCGVIWNKIEERQRIARQLLEAEEEEA